MFEDEERDMDSEDEEEDGSMGDDEDDPTPEITNFDDEDEEDL